MPMYVYIYAHPYVYILHRDRLPVKRTVHEFVEKSSEAQGSLFWMVIEPPAKKTARSSSQIWFFTIGNSTHD